MAEIHIEPKMPQSHVYGPGEIVAGSAIFIPHFNARLQSLRVSLKGECYTSSLGSNSKVSNTVPLFSVVCDLLQKVYTYRSERYEAPFEFLFPEETTLEHEAGPEALMPLFNQGPQYLPDSFVLSTRNTVQMIRYYIHVELHGRSKASAEITVLFRQPFGRLNEDTQSREEQSEDGTVQPLVPGINWRPHKTPGYGPGVSYRPQIFSEQAGGPPLSLHALPMMSAHHKSCWERYKHAKAHQQRGALDWLLKPWRTPRIIFMPSVYLPKKVAVAQEIPLLLAVDTIRNPMWHGQDTTLILEGFSIAITAHTRTIMQNKPSKRRWGRCMELSYAVLEVAGLSTKINIDGNPLPLITSFKILPGSIPSFSTYTINRGYSVDVYFKFRYEGDQLEWGASMGLELTSDDSVEPAKGVNIDPLLFTDPRHPPEVFWKARIEAGAAEGTGRANVYPQDPLDEVNLPNAQWETGHGRLPRSSYACASALMAPGLTPLRTRKKKPTYSVVAGVCGRPHRRYLRDLEPMVAPLYTFGAGLGIGLDGAGEGEGEGEESSVMIAIDECGIMRAVEHDSGL